MRRQVNWIAVLVLVGVTTGMISTSLSCNRSRQGATSDAQSSSVAEQPPPGAHWVQDERLRAVMGRISEHTKLWPAGVPRDAVAAAEQLAESQEADAMFRDAAALADGLAESAEQHHMAPGDRRDFNTEAHRLRRQALELKTAAEGRRVERMQRALDAISSTCVGCHGKYRVFAGELGPRKATLE